MAFNAQLVDINLYGIPNCDTVKKARAWLSEHQLAYQFHDFKKINITMDLVMHWLQHLSIDTLINRQGTTWRTLSTDIQARVNSIEGAIYIMQTHPSVIKRPVLTLSTNQPLTQCVYVGFKPEQYQQIFMND